MGTLQSSDLTYGDEETLPMNTLHNEIKSALHSPLNFTQSYNTVESFIQDQEAKYPFDPNVLDADGFFKSDTAYNSAPIGVKRYRKKDTTTSTENFAQKALRTMTNEQIIDRLMYDLNFLAKFVAPEICKYDFPDNLQSIWQMVVRGLIDMEDFIAEARYVLGIPRSFTKTTLMKLALVYNTIFSTKTFMLVVGSTNPKAEAIIKDAVSMLRSPQMEAVFGQIAKFEKNSASHKEFTFLGKPIVFFARGVLTDLRGVNIGNKRPNFILADDMQSEENAKSPTESDALITWFSSTLLEVADPDGYIFIYVGNTYAHDGALITHLIQDPEWTSNTIGAITADGKSLWEELKPLSKLLSGYLQAKKLNKEANWLAQMMNAIDINMNTSVDLELVESTSMESWGFLEAHPSEPVVKYLVIDPASSRDNADDVAIAYCESYVHQIPVVQDLTSRQRNPMTTIQDAIKLCLDNDCYVILIEGIAYQQTLQFWMDYFLDEWEIDWIEVSIFNAHRSSKNTRILNSFDYLETGDIILSPQALDTFKVQAKIFNHLKTNNLDDGLDAISEAKLQLQDKHYAISEAHERGFLKHAEVVSNQKRHNSNGYKVSAI